MSVHLRGVFTCVAVWFNMGLIISYTGDQIFWSQQHILTESWTDTGVQLHYAITIINGP